MAIERGKLRPTIHALERMKERRIILSDVKEAIYNGRRDEVKDEFNKKTGQWKYAIQGLNDDRDKDIRLIISFNDPLAIIITVIDLN